ncbi:MAG: 23S rRNA (uracil(1939)-C(5))-methyltransferase RlmD [Lachnospiraceae bacterium]|nr:23S rRNA (uracil(1939)-C(5))-methyltransferase RlmD [Lachnospiraceae bacterium]
MLFGKGARLTLVIEDLTDTGEGIGHADGWAFFVKDAIPGDIVEATVMKMKSRYGYAHLDRIVTPSPDRVEPPCAVARACGGCQLQVMDYPAELHWKEKRVRQTLTRIGGIPEETLDKIMHPIMGMESGTAYRYRNKAQLPVAADRDGRLITGFYAARTHSVIRMDDCLLGDPVFSEIARIILKHAERAGLTAYDEKTGTGLLRHILIRKGHHSGQIGVTPVVNAVGNSADADRILPGASELAEALFTAIPGMTSLSLNLNTARSNVILGRELVPVRGDLRIEDEMCGLRFRISPLSFYQVNTAQAERLYRQAMEFAGLIGKETVIDLYCGIGTITLLAARQAARVIGVEVVPEAIADAEQNAALNGITNAAFRVGKAEEVLPKLLDEGIRADVLIVDPPRAGLDPSCIEAIRILAPSRIIYISCNPATLARDLRLLCGDDSDREPSAAYRPEAVRACDLFAKTVHVEVCCLLERLRSAKDHIEISIDADDYYRIKDNK